jgi:hypothetical protein
LIYIILKDRRNSMVRIDKIRPYPKELNPIAHGRILSLGIMNYMGGCGKTSGAMSYAPRRRNNVLYLDFDPETKSVCTKICKY